MTERKSMLPECSFNIDNAVSASSSDSKFEDSDKPTNGCDSGKDKVASLLDMLCAPQVLAVKRKRMVFRNRVHSGKHQYFSSSTSSDPKHVPPLQRVKEFPGEHFVLSNHKLFCKACKIET